MVLVLQLLDIEAFDLIVSQELCHFLNFVFHFDYLSFCFFYHD